MNAHEAQVDPLTCESGALEFSETNSPWRPVPSWVTFLVNCGYAYGALSSSFRRISIISLPCDSAGAGIVALGALRYRLSVLGADDCGSHFQRLEQLAAKRAGTTYLRHQTYKGRFQITAGGNGSIWVERDASMSPKGLKATAIFPWNATEWHIEGEPPVLPLQGDDQAYGPFYDMLVKNAPGISCPNLSRSDSAVCLAGRVTGEAASRAILATVRFRNGNRFVDLSQLSTVHGWSDGAASRMTFFNTRTGQFDRCPVPPSTVVADGDLALHRVLSTKELAETNVVGVMHRAIERDRLEALGNKIAELRQWYSPDTECILVPPPAGIAISVFKRGHA